MSEEQQDNVGARRKAPFKLCFVSKNLMGRSKIQVGKPLTLPAPIITSKFYSVNETKQDFDNGELEKHIQYLNIAGPRDKYNDPVTENQRYGWYQMTFTDLDKSDRRLHHAKNTNPIVQEHLMNYQNIR